MKKKVVLTLCYYSIFILVLPLKAQIGEVPIEINDSGHIYLKVKINDNQELLNFVFDTGATLNLLSPASASRLGLEPNYQQQVRGASGSKTYDVIRNQKLALSQNIEVDNANLILSDLTHLDENIDGIIGLSLLNKYVVEMDYENKKLRLFNKIDDFNLVGYSAIPFQFNNGLAIPQFDISLNLKNGETVSGKVLFDSGAGLSLMVNTPFNHQNEVAKKSGKTLRTTTKSLTSKSFLEQAVIESLTLGEFTFGEMTVLLSHDTQGVSSFTGYLGMIGADIIGRFNVVLDYQTKTLYLKPNTYFDDVFDFPVSGIQLENKEDAIFISFVAETSPAYTMGLRTGDKLESINDQTSADIDTYRKMLKKEGDTVTIEVITQKGERKTFTLGLDRLL